ncbi:ufm1-specific protease 2-like [Panonychus citri]|uniref:ufm1-specific protease 2-like n=1 Tax=Panonychus citri TaxID=50023 RepID=UPI0023073815|nr:ufm1-specific protease 2-like [Panonychus citri]
MKVNVKFVSGKSIELDNVDPIGDTIQSIADRISNVTGLPLTSVGLFTSDGKKALEGSKILSDYGLDDDSSTGDGDGIVLLCKRNILVRVCGSIRLTISSSSTPDKMKKSINSAYKQVYDSFKKVNFNLDSSDYVLDGTNSPKEILNHLYKYIKDSEYSEIEGVKMSSAMKAKMFDKLFTKRLTELSPIQLTFNLDDDCKNDDGNGDNGDGGDNFGGKQGKINNDEKLFLSIDYDSENELQLTINIDCINEFPEDTKLQGLPKALITSIRRQIEEMRICAVNCFDVDNTKIHLPGAYHYRLTIKWDHSPKLFTLIYPISLADDELIELRRKYHEKLNLPLDRPCIRKANAIKFNGDNYRQRYIINPHLGVPSSGSTGGKVTTVQGDYGYHHYTQDGYNDSGWGCAYRSLQTIISWFKLQGYIEIDNIPTHKQIQEALVACGDKDASFIGKEKWIGSQEVSYVLSQLYNITSKIMFVNSGRELGSKGSELKHHFETNGTPIMIGGGVLAHTIIGIDFDENSGQLNFLILDPHYTGPEDLSTIVKKGWCNWKKPDFWNPSAFYNLCLPQKPKTF